MLKITTHSDAEGITLKVEGRLAGPWVEELKNCWAQESVAKHQVKVVLSEVTFIDQKGEGLLVDMHEHGVELMATGCMTKAIIDEILRGKKS